jgi:hypothetical protein
MQVNLSLSNVILWFVGILLSLGIIESCVESRRQTRDQDACTTESLGHALLGNSIVCVDGRGAMFYPKHSSDEFGR